MAKLTRDGICYDLPNSPYFLKVQYQDNKYVIYKFSSTKNLEKFKNKLEENREKINDSLSKRFKFEIVINFICDVTLYKNVESRGFSIFSNGVLIECLENLKLSGVEVMKKN